MNCFQASIPIMKALCDETRLQILSMLSEREMNGCEIHRAFDCTQPTISYHMKALVDVDVKEWDAVLGVNLRGAFLATKHAARAMIARGNGGRIVNIASQAAKSAFPFAAAYCSSKHGLVGLTRVSALELGQHGIRVNAVCPNHVTTGLGAWQNEYFAKAQGVSVDEYLAAMRKRIPLGRPGLASDTANACAFLCSDDAQYMTGEAINVSGGEENH